MSVEFYKSRIKYAIDYIDQHLDQKILISDLANASGFSLFHFQRIFKQVMNETPYETILRTRLERGIFYLKRHPKKMITEIAFLCGFDSVESFSRQFKHRYKYSPSEIKKNENVLDAISVSNESFNDRYQAHPDPNNVNSFPVKVEYREQKQIALIHSIFGTDGSSLVENYEHLIKWYKSKIRNTWPKRYGMSIDDPDVTPSDKYRYDFAVEVETDFLETDQIIRSEIPSGYFAVLHCNGDIQVVSEAWTYLYEIWLPQSDYVPKNYPAIEEFLKGPEEIGWTEFNMNCLIPIEKQ